MDDCVNGVIHGVLSNNPLEHYLVHSSFRKQTLPTTELGDSYYGIECVLALESWPCEKCPGDHLDVVVSVLEENKSHGEPPSSSKEGPVLKQLPEHLHYAFLEGQYEFPIIISASLSSQEEEKLLEVLRRHKLALGWSIVDIKGISPTIYMHKILMEESFKLSIEHQ